MRWRGLISSQTCTFLYSQAGALWFAHRNSKKSKADSPTCTSAATHFSTLQQRWASFVSFEIIHTNSLSKPADSLVRYSLPSQKILLQMCTKFKCPFLWFFVPRSFSESQRAFPAQGSQSWLPGPLWPALPAQLGVSSASGRLWGRNREGTPCHNYSQGLFITATSRTLFSPHSCNSLGQKISDH